MQCVSDMKQSTKFRVWTAVAIACTAMSIDNHANAEVHTASDKNGVPGLKVTLNDTRIRRSGKEIVFYPVFQATGTKKIGNVCIDNDRYAWIDDEEPISTYMHRLQFDVPDNGDPLSKLVEINNVPLDAKILKKIKIAGRAPDSEKSNAGNYYGDFDYTFINIPIPQFHEVATDKANNRPGGMFTDTEIRLSITDMEKDGSDLKVTFTLTNAGKSDKNITSEEGYATTTEGDRLATSVRIPETLPSGETVKGILYVTGGANEDLCSIRHKFMLLEKGLQWNPELGLR